MEGWRDFALYMTFPIPSDGKPSIAYSIDRENRSKGNKHRTWVLSSGREGLLGRLSFLS